MTIITENIKPIVKWAGGKRQLLHEIIPLIPNNISTYVEPFVGGGAVLFKLQPKNAIINDINEELINLYQVIKDSPRELIRELEYHKANDSKEYFYSIRGMDREEDFKLMDSVLKAARTIYLNKTCFNGLYRVNSKGYFNVPYANNKNPLIVDRETIFSLSEFFNKHNIQMTSGSYNKVHADLSSDSFVYLDPPYYSAFASYSKDGFSDDEHKKLKAECDKLNEKGIKFLLSNSDYEFIRELYKDYNIKTVQAKRTINCKGNRRGKVNEILIYNY